MNKRILILPVILLLCMFFVGWHAYIPMVQANSNQPAIDQLTAEVNRIYALPSGSAFNFTVSDDTLTMAAEEAFQKYGNEIKAAVTQLVNVNIDIDKPEVEFLSDGTIKISAKAGKGIFKVGVGVNGKINLVDGKPEIFIEKIDVPIINVSEETANSEIKGLTNQYMNYLTDFCTLSKIEVTEGQAVIEGIVK